MAKKNKKPKKTTSCGSLAWREKEGNIEVLLIKQFANKDRWGIPKGHVNHDETLEQCAVRETREETGVSVALGIRLPDCRIVNSSEDKTVVSWLAQCTGDDVPRSDDPNSEVADARWFDIDALPELISYQRSMFVIAVEMLRKTVVSTRTV